MTAAWSPVADVHDVVPRHLVRTALHGNELVVWRADDDNLNVWENRCLHRGVRLSIGVNDGAELVCRYHAWRYANGSGGCTYIPAHPADSPARTAQCATFPVVERYGLIWTTLDSGAAGSPPTLDGLDPHDVLVLRARPVAAPSDRVLDALAALSFAPVGAEPSAPISIERSVGDDRVTITATSGDAEDRVVFLVQPVTGTTSVIRPVLAGRPAAVMPTLREHARLLGRLVESIERDVGPPPAVTEPETPVPIPSVTAKRRTVQIDRKWETAAGIMAFDLVDPDGADLPAVQPGDHLDVFLPGGLTRQYSLTNGPGETRRYRIGVKRTADSRGGSVQLHDEVSVGDRLEIAGPKNHFALRRNTNRTVLVAGGIGVTPILAMAQALARGGNPYELHYFASSDAEFAFPEILDSLGSALHRHVGLDPEQTAARLEALLDGPADGDQVAACGPPPMLAALRSIAAAAGWPDDAVSFEYFDAGEIDTSSTFTVELARSARTIPVPAGVSVLEALRDDGVDVTSSCERGACGTCSVAVLDGTVDHHDVYLSPDERAAGDVMLTCVSRAASARLVLDL